MGEETELDSQSTTSPLSVPSPSPPLSSFPSPLAAVRGITPGQIYGCYFAVGEF